MTDARVESFILENETTSGLPFRVIAKRYTVTPPNGTGPVVIFMHGTGFHKETWEPTIEALLAHDDTLEAWAIDGPKHGESAALSGLAPSQHLLTIEGCARVVLSLFKSDPCPIANLQQRPLFIVGHSAGGSAAAILVSLFDHPNMDLILVEPVPELFTPDPEKLKSHRGLLFYETTKAKRDIWPDRQIAREWHASRPLWKTWDPKVLDLFMKYGLRDLPTAEYSDKKDGVTLACNKADELWVYSPEGFSLFHDCVRVFQSSTLHRAPVHIIFGGKSVFRLKPTDPIYKNITGKLGCSVDTIPKAGHLVVQEAPTALAGCLHGHIARSINAHKSKL